MVHLTHQQCFGVPKGFAFPRRAPVLVLAPQTALSQETKGSQNLLLYLKYQVSNLKL